jgi:hypothetical protein
MRVSLPLMGRIAAGVPIEAISEASHQVAVPGGRCCRAGEHYALEVKGDSMIDAGINDGDIVVIRETPDGRQRRHRRGAGRGAGGDAQAVPPQGRRMIALEAANPAYETRVFPRTGQGAGAARRSDPHLLTRRTPERRLRRPRPTASRAVTSPSDVIAMRTPPVRRRSRGSRPAGPALRPLTGDTTICPRDRPVPHGSAARLPVTCTISALAQVGTVRRPVAPGQRVAAPA